MAKQYRDYSRKFDPHLNWQSFSKDTLIELLNLYGKLFMAVDGFWYLAVKEIISDEQALACDIWVWEKAIKYELERTTRLMNIEGNDVATLMKALQLSPWFRCLNYEIDMKDSNNGILTVTHCPTLEYLEKEGGERIESICGYVEPKCLKGYAEFFNPNMRVKLLKIPPRRSKQEICCQWEFSL